MPTQIDTWDSISIAVETPTGKMFVHILEEEGKPAGILINAGKTGTSVAAWATSLASLITTQFRAGIGINSVIENLSQQTSDRAITDPNGVVIRSGPDGVLFALLQYRKQKFLEFKQTLDGNDDGFFDS